MLLSGKGPHFGEISCWTTDKQCICVENKYSLFVEQRYSVDGVEQIAL